jgi:hypothetical protein
MVLFFFNFYLGAFRMCVWWKETACIRVMTASGVGSDWARHISVGSAARLPTSQTKHTHTHTKEVRKEKKNTLSEFNI